MSIKQTYKCPYCGKECKKYGLRTHIWRAHTKEGKSFDSNSSLKTGKRTIWNKGMTKDTHNSMAKLVNTRLEKYDSGELIPSFKGKTHSKKSRDIMSQKMISAIKDGRHQGWTSRKNKSYAEIYFENILNNNNIEFEPEYHIFNGKLNYFLDFYIPEYKINVEIDGSQHKQEERRKSDERRDNYLNSLGITVFRVEWKNPKTKEGKKYIIYKTNELLDLINKRGIGV